MDDVDAIAARIAMDDIAAALRFYGAVEATMAYLGELPGAGTRRSPTDPSLSGLRSYGVIGFRAYLMFFVPSATAVRVIRVLHGACDTDAIMGAIA